MILPPPRNRNWPSSSDSFPFALTITISTVNNFDRRAMKLKRNEKRNQMSIGRRMGWGFGWGLGLGLGWG